MLFGTKPPHFGNRGATLDILGFIEQNWNCKCKGDVSIYSEDVTNVSHSDVQEVLTDIRKSNVNKVASG